MTRLLLLACVSTIACGTLPHPIERGAGYTYESCAGKSMQGSAREVECATTAEATCREAGFHKNCWVDYAFERRLR